MNNVFAQLPTDLEQESFQDLLKSSTIRIERIVSRGQQSPAEGWYDQAENEWVLVLEGAAVILLEEGGREIRLERGDYLNIPAHAKHKVLWTDPDHVTVWLAVFYI
jgi:cupin 2 domain-containing protein